MTEYRQNGSTEYPSSRLLKAACGGLSCCGTRACADGRKRDHGDHQHTIAKRCHGSLLTESLFACGLWAFVLGRTQTPGAFAGPQLEASTEAGATRCARTWALERWLNLRRSGEDSLAWRWAVQRSRSD